MFRAALVLAWLILLIYTGVVIANHGADLLQVFFGDIARMGWPGQFNLDFLMLLLLAGLWVAWRARFSATGLALGLVAMFGGCGFLLPFLVYLSFRADGDIRKVLLGDRVLG